MCAFENECHALPLARPAPLTVAEANTSEHWHGKCSTMLVNMPMHDSVGCVTIWCVMLTDHGPDTEPHTKTPPFPPPSIAQFYADHMVGWSSVIPPLPMPSVQSVSLPPDTLDTLLVLVKDEPAATAFGRAQLWPEAPLFTNNTIDSVDVAEGGTADDQGPMCTRDRCRQYEDFLRHDVMAGPQPYPAQQHPLIQVDVACEHPLAVAAPDPVVVRAVTHPYGNLTALHCPEGQHSASLPVRFCMHVLR